MLVAAVLASATESPTPHIVAPVLSISSDESLLAKIKDGYLTDPWCLRLLEKGVGLAGVSKRNGLLYVSDRLVVPRVADVRESLFQLAHDSLGHFGAAKSYAALRESFYWPNMCRDLEESYIPGCVECCRNKSPTQKLVGPLHSLNVPDGRFKAVALDFVGPLPDDEGFNYLLTITDRLGADIWLIPCNTDLSAERAAVLFFNNWYCENGLLREIISDRDKLFVSRFWSALHKLTGVKLKLSSSFHPQTDGSNERTNKTVIQALRYFVDCNQKGWVKALPHIRFCYMNTVNASTGFSPFQLHLGYSPRTVPALEDRVSPAHTDVDDLIQKIDSYVSKAKDSLLAAKISQSISANPSRRQEIPYKVGDMVYLSTSNHRREYTHAGDGCIAKFMPRFDGPYKVTRAFPERWTYTLLMPNSPGIFPMFHASQLRAFTPNDPDLFPSRELERPDAVQTDEGDEEWFVEKIIDEKHGQSGREYLVRYRGYSAEEDRWLPRADVEDLAALDVWLDSHTTSTTTSSSTGRRPTTRSTLRRCCPTDKSSG